MNNINIGLEGVEVGATAISNVDGERGELSYRGHPIAELAEQNFVRVAWLLLFGEWPNPHEEAQLGQFLSSHAVLTRAERDLLAAIPADTHPMLMLQALVPLLNTVPLESIDLPSESSDAVEGLIVAAKIPSLVAAYYRREQDLEWPLVSHGGDPIAAFLKNLHGRTPAKAQVDALRVAQILQMEHSYNAGTFCGRVALSTDAPVVSSISASIGTLFGRLHGGADQAALEMAVAIGSADKAAAYVQEQIARGERIMGIGHREYQTLDPRAAVLKPLARSVCQQPEHLALLDTLEAVEQACVEALEKPGKTLRANVEFYKGAVFYALGVPPHFFTSLFAMARVWGYLAHALEFRPEARLIRPRARYIGPEIKH